MEGYWCYWHGGKGYSGVALHVSKSFAPERPGFAHPTFDYETRIATVEIGDLTVASVYVPNGGKDFPPRCSSSRRWISTPRDFRAPNGAW
jgi:exodeoxyribonuclease-3